MIKKWIINLINLNFIFIYICQYPIENLGYSKLNESFNFCNYSELVSGYFWINSANFWLNTSKFGFSNTMKSFTVKEPDAP